jgi:integrase
MRGHIKKRSTWQFTVDLGLQPLQRCPACRKRYWTKDGRLKRCPKCSGPLEDGLARRQEFHSGYASKKEAETELAKVAGALASGTHIEASRLLLDDFLKKRWLPAIRPTVRATTFLSYEGHIENHLVPVLGRIPLQQLTATQINAFYAKLLVENKKSRAGKVVEGGGENEEKKTPLAPATVRRIHATLHRALRDAVRWNLINRNPADAADPPRAPGCAGARVNVWSIADLKRFLASEKESRLYPLWLLLITTGMRRGEAMGLRWQDIDLDASTIAIRQTRVLLGYQPLLSTPKTQKGRRLVALDPATTATLGALWEQREEECIRQGRRTQQGDLVFITEKGEPLHPERVTRLFKRASKKAGVPEIRLHDLRHTHATLALSAGVHPKIVSERLGHANIGITLDTYSHCLPALSEEAACRVAALVVSEEPR